MMLWTTQDKNKLKYNLDVKVEVHTIGVWKLFYSRKSVIRMCWDQRVFG